MKESRLIVSILSIIFSIAVSAYSYYIWVGETIRTENNQIDILQVGGALALCMLLAGIIGIVCLKYKYVILFCSFFYLIAILFTVLKDCRELYVWCVPNLIFMGTFLCTGVLQKENKLK